MINNSFHSNYAASHIKYNKFHIEKATLIQQKYRKNKETHETNTHLRQIR